MLLYEEITHEIINAFYAVYNKLGYGFLEKVYEKSLVIELRKRNFVCEAQSQINVLYDGETVGLYFADILVNEIIIIEIKATENICSEHETQLINYLKATKMEVGLLFNFGKRPQFKRKIYLNENKFE
jgi:GxxExxY protein